MLPKLPRGWSWVANPPRFWTNLRIVHHPWGLWTVVYWGSVWSDEDRAQVLSRLLRALPMATRFFLDRRLPRGEFTIATVEDPLWPGGFILEIGPPVQPIRLGPRDADPALWLDRGRA